MPGHGGMGGEGGPGAASVLLRGGPNNPLSGTDSLVADLAD